VTFRTKHRILAAAALAAVLSACGGGGGSAPAAPAPAPAPATPARADYALQTSVPAPTYTDPRKTALLNRLNAMRAAVGVGLLQQNSALDAAAQGHAEYLARNLLPPGHVQDPSKPGYTGTYLQDRTQAAGYTGFVGEGVGGMPTGYLVANYGDFVDAFMNTVYHGDAMAGTWREVGIGIADSANGDYVVLDYGYARYPQLPDSGVVTHYPYDGQSGVQTTFDPEGEWPRPVPGAPGPWGPSIRVSLQNFGEATAPNSTASDVTITRATLMDGFGNLVPARVVAKSGTQAGPGVVLTTDANEVYLALRSYYILPNAPLTPGQQYTVVFEATGRAGSYAKTWRFTTQN